MPQVINGRVQFTPEELGQLRGVSQSQTAVMGMPQPVQEMIAGSAPGGGEEERGLSLSRAGVSGGLGAVLGALGGPKIKAARVLGGAALGAASDLLGQGVENKLQDMGAGPGVAMLAGLGAQAATGLGIGRLITRMKPSEAYALYDNEIGKYKGHLTRDILLSMEAPDLDTSVNTGAGRYFDDAIRGIKGEGVRGSGVVGWGAKPYIQSPDVILKRLGSNGEYVNTVFNKLNQTERMVHQDFGGEVEGLFKKYPQFGKADWENVNKLLFYGVRKGGVIDDIGMPLAVKAIGRTPTSEELAAATEFRGFFDRARQFLEGERVVFTKGGQDILFKGTDTPYSPAYATKASYENPMLSKEAELRQKFPNASEMEITKAVHENRGIKPTLIQGDPGYETTSGRGNTVYQQARHGAMSWESRDLPPYTPPTDMEWDLRVTARRYAKDMAKHYAIFKEAGPNFRNIENALMYSAYRRPPDGGDPIPVPEIKNWGDKFLAGLRSAHYSDTPESADMMRNVRAFITATSMVTSTLPNAAQSGSTIALTGMKNFAKGWMNNPKAVAEKAGTFIGREADDMLNSLDALGNSFPQKFARGTLKVTQFNNVETYLNRMGANAAGWAYGEDIAQRAMMGKARPSEIRYLREAGINPEQVIKTGKLSDEELTRFAIWTEKTTQFGTRPWEVPEKWQTPVGKTITQFKNFAYSQTKFVSRLIKSAVTDYRQTGDLRSFDPVLRFAAIAPVFGSVVYHLRSFLAGREVKGDALDTIINYYSAVGAMGLGLDFVQNLTKGPIINGLAYLAGPAATKGVKAGSYALRGKLPEAVEQVVGPGPGIVGNVAGMVYGGLSGGEEAVKVNEFGLTEEQMKYLGR